MGRDEAGGYCRDYDGSGNREERHGIRAFHLEEKARHESGERQRGRESNGHADDDQSHAVAQHQSNHARGPAAGATSESRISSRMVSISDTGTRGSIPRTGGGE